MLYGGRTEKLFMNRPVMKNAWFGVSRTYARNVNHDEQRISYI